LDQNDHCRRGRCAKRCGGQFFLSCFTDIDVASLGRALKGTGVEHEREETHRDLTERRTCRPHPSRAVRLPALFHRVVGGRAGPQTEETDVDTIQTCPTCGGAKLQAGRIDQYGGPVCWCHWFDNHHSAPTRGCICPPGAEATCQGSDCPRRFRSSGVATTA
jgi:hypothetical protein